VKAGLPQSTQEGEPSGFFGLQRLTVLIANQPESPHDFSVYFNKLMEYFFVTDGAELSEDGQET